MKISPEGTSTPSSTSEDDFLGCYIDSANSRILSLDSVANGAMAVEACSSYRTDFVFYGLGYGRECWCGKQEPTAAAPETDCAMLCAGNATQICGNANRLSVYQNSEYTAAAPAVLPNASYQGCYTDSTASRTLSEMMVYGDLMTPKLCASTCSFYPFFGVEYAMQCYCGSTIARQQVPESECFWRCAGDITTLCGAPNRINICALQDE